MDNYPTSWAPRRAVVVSAWSVTALLLVAVVADAVADDRRGAVLFGVGVLLAGALATHSTLVRPRLLADAEGLTARTMGGKHRLPWGETRTRLRSARRLGRDSVALEVEHGDELYVFGWWDLGEDPRDVLDVLSALRAQS